MALIMNLLPSSPPELSLSHGRKKLVVNSVFIVYLTAIFYLADVREEGI